MLCSSNDIPAQLRTCLPGLTTARAPHPHPPVSVCGPTNSCLERTGTENEALATKTTSATKASFTAWEAIASSYSWNGDDAEEVEEEAEQLVRQKKVVAWRVLRAFN